MAARKPIVMNGGQQEALQSGDVLYVGYEIPCVIGSPATALKSDGTDSYWGTINEVPVIGGQDGWTLTWNGDSYGWVPSIGSNTIIEDIHLYVTTDGDDGVGDGSFENPWATIDRAIEYISDKFILNPAVVYIEVEAGNYPTTDILTIGHVNGSQVQILGDYNTETGIALTSMAGAAKNHTIVFTTAHPDWYTVNDYVLLYYATGGTDPRYAEGVHKVVSIVNAVVTLNSVTDSATNASGAVTFSITLPFVRLNRRISVTSNIGNIEGLQIVVAPASANEAIIDLGVNSYCGGTIIHTVVRSTVAQNGIGVSIGRPGYWIFSYSGIANTKYSVFLQSAVLQLMRSVLNGNIYGVYGIAQGNFYGYGNEATIVGNTTGIYLTDMSLYRHGATPVIIGNGTNYSPAEHTSGNNGSFMG